MEKHVLVVDDEANVCEVVCRLLEREGYAVSAASSAEEGMALFDESNFDCVISDIRMPGASGIELLEHVHAADPLLPVILLTAQASLQAAIDAVNKGAYHFVRKPFTTDELRGIVHSALEMRQAKQENQHLRTELRRSRGTREIIGKSREIGDVLRMADRVAGSDCTVLLTGESGTGKELFARAIHRRSNRVDEPFVTVNCGALPESLLESELFGHVKGAFTSAHRNKDGLFLVADQGTIFLDEIGETTPAIQVKLLRALQEREIHPVGSTRSMDVNVRVIAATNQDLDARVADGQFRADLFYRLNVVPIQIPALRERPDDVAILVEYFLRRSCESAGVAPKRFDQDAATALRHHAWPGNVRELENLIERAVILEDSEIIGVDALPASITNGRRAVGSSAVITDANPTLAELERRYIMQVLEDSGWRKKRASEILGIDTSTLYRKIQRYRLRRDPLDTRRHAAGRR